VSDPAPPIAEEDLHAWIDGQLGTERQAAVLRYLQEQPDVARRVDAWHDQREALRAAFAVVAAEPVPPRLGLERLIQQRLGRRRLPWRSPAVWHGQQDYPRRRTRAGSKPSPPGS